MCPIVPRAFNYTDAGGSTTNYDAGYHNASLGTAGVAILFPPGASGAIVSVGAGCYIGVRGTSTLDTFSDANYGSILNGDPYQIGKGATTGETTGDSSKYLHLATWTSTTSVAVAFY